MNGINGHQVGKGKFVGRPRLAASRIAYGTTCLGIFAHRSNMAANFFS